VTLATSSYTISHTITINALVALLIVRVVKKQGLPSATFALKDTPLISIVIPVNLVLQTVPNAILLEKINVMLDAAYKGTDQVAQRVKNVEVMGVVIVLNMSIHANNVSQDSIKSLTSVMHVQRIAQSARIVPRALHVSKVTTSTLRPTIVCHPLPISFKQIAQVSFLLWCLDYC
jgi:hypothetical protein